MINRTEAYRPAKSSGRSSAFFGIFFKNLPLSRFILKFFRFFRTLVVIEMLLFSSSFAISVLFGDVDVEMEKVGSFCVTDR